MNNTDYKLDAGEILSLSRSLRKIEQNILKPSQEEGITKIWFQGEEPDFDVFFEFYYDELSWFQFTWRGKSLSWDRKQPGLQTGTTNELCVNDASFYAATKTIETDNQADDNFINLVKSIIQTKTEEPMFAKALALFG
ncbi:hypothetical protein [Nostoc sp. MS1]|uniref:hypothetical protein n=1 Tax=Nostoc sp. MS1 TaxID=2764711 RepID=UPI001CC7D328|nr:hypothetical protein [Nostoc sp. MS1]BCL35660.1 hypothetical protein NSMS1_21070 [Nostoc sp. MS1]